MKCKYCGKEMVMGQSCFKKKKKKCVGIPDSTNCVYCNQRFVANGHCFNSPSTKHQLSS